MSVNLCFGMMPTSMITVVHSMVRIKGKNTVEMIKVLTGIETVVID